MRIRNIKDNTDGYRTSKNPCEYMYKDMEIDTITDPGERTTDLACVISMMKSNMYMLRRMFLGRWYAGTTFKKFDILLFSMMDIIDDLNGTYSRRLISAKSLRKWAYVRAYEQLAILLKDEDIETRNEVMSVVARRCDTTPFRGAFLRSYSVDTPQKLTQVVKNSLKNIPAHKVKDLVIPQYVMKKMGVEDGDEY